MLLTLVRLPTMKATRYEGIGGVVSKACRVWPLLREAADASGMLASTTWSLGAVIDKFHLACSTPHAIQDYSGAYTLCGVSSRVCCKLGMSGQCENIRNAGAAPSMRAHQSKGMLSVRHWTPSESCP